MYDIFHCPKSNLRTLMEVNMYKLPVNKKKKILLIHHSDSIGGAGISLINTYKKLRDDYEVIVYIPHLNSDLEDYCKVNGVEIRAFCDNVGMISSYSGGPKILTRTFIKNSLKIINTKKKLKSILDKEKPDVVAVNSMTVAWAGKLAKKCGIKCVCFVRETYVDNLVMKYIQKLLDKYFDGVVFITEYDKNKFKCKAPVIGVVPDCIDIKIYQTRITKEQACQKLGIDKDTFNVLYVGGTSELKGWSVIAKSLEMLDNHNIILVVAGKLDERKIIYNKRIKYIGLQSEMLLVYRACDVLVFPSTSPHQARPAFEAGVMGLPVIISDFDETRENIRNYVNGLTFTPGSSSDLKDKILKLYNDKELLLKLGQANKAHSIRTHGFENCKQKLLDIMFDIVNKGEV